MDLNKKNIMNKIGVDIRTELLNILLKMPEKTIIIGNDEFINDIKLINNNKQFKDIYSYNSSDVKKDISFIDKIIMKLMSSILPEDVLIMPEEDSSYIASKLKNILCYKIYCFSSKEVKEAKDYSRFLKHSDKIQSVYDNLEDETSKKVYESVIRARVFNDEKCIWEIHESEDKEYFDNSIIRLTDNEVFLDAGAYTGDTLIKFLNNTNMSFQRIYLFEPDKRSYMYLKEQLSNEILVSNDKNQVKFIDIKNVIDKIESYNLGVYDEKNVMNFNSNLLKGSHISGNLNMDLKGKSYKEDIVCVAKLDDLFKNTKISFIKMDIEGSEYEALKGMRNIVISQKPKMAICIYHQENHLWSIPLLLKELNKDYKIYIRHYGLNCWDTVCYATL